MKGRASRGASVSPIRTKSPLRRVPPRGEGYGTERMRLDTQLSRDSGSVGRARDAVLASFADDVSPATLDELTLLVSELVTNSVRHADADADRGIGLRAGLVNGSVRVEVSDWGRDFDPRVQPSADDIGGWGLYLVDSLADRWGLLRTKPKVVWFEIDDPKSSPKSSGRGSSPNAEPGHPR
jgi:anti-sigma regulatory factor (Ser/Thr protein kinase)